MVKLLQEHSKPVAQGIVSSTLFELLRWGGSASVGYVAKHWAEIWGMSKGWAFLLWFAVFVIFAVGITLGRYFLRRNTVPDAPQVEHDEWVPLLPARERARQAPIQIFNNPTISPTFNNSPSITQNPVQSQSQTQIQPTHPIEIKALPAKMRETFITASGEVTDKPESWGMENGKLPVAFAEIYRGADRSQEPFVDVRAHILFLDANETLLHRVNDAWWWKSHRHHATFRPGDSRILVVAVISEKRKLFPYDGHLERVEATYETDEKYLVLGDDFMDGNNFRVKIELIGTRGSLTTFSDSVEYDLVVEPPSFSLRT